MIACCLDKTHRTHTHKLWVHCVSSCSVTASCVGKAKLYPKCAHSCVCALLMKCTCLICCFFFLVACLRWVFSEVSVATLKQLALTKGSMVRSLNNLVPYLDFFANQEYLVRRIKGPPSSFVYYYYLSVCFLKKGAFIENVHMFCIVWLK